MPRWVSSPFQNFGSRLTLAVRPTPNAVKIINIGLHLQLPGRRSNPWAKFLGMPVLCLCRDMSYSNFINLAQGLHNWCDPLQMRCHFSKHTSGLLCWSLVRDLILQPNFWKCWVYLIQLSKLWLWAYISCTDLHKSAPALELFQHQHKPYWELYMEWNHRHVIRSTVQTNQWMS